MARALAAVDRGAKVLAVAHPTRGVDLKASEGIHDELRWARDKELAVLVISADLRELRSLCSRILVMTRGRIVGEFGPDASDETLGQAMLGGDHGEVEDVAGGQGHRHHPGHHQPGPDGDAAARTVSSEHDVEGKAP
jgi:ABC-type Na+ transport system ATPase subunit NatA